MAWCRGRLGMVVPRITGICLLLLATQACSPSARSDESLDVVVDTVGDTVSVFTNGPGAWIGPATLAPTLSIGELEGRTEFLFGRVSSIAVDDSGTLYVLDRQADEIRAFSPDGTFLRTYGRRGEGPGELMGPMAIAVLSDKRVLARDPRNRRVQVFRADGSADGEWTLLSSGYTNFATPLWVDDEDRAYVVTRDQRQDVMSSGPIVIIVAADGSVLDTIRPPTVGFEPPMLEAQVESTGGTSHYWSPVPFGPQAFWAVHSSGSLIRAISADYSVDLIRSDGSVLRMGRAHEPIPVQPAERASAESSVTAGMRVNAPDWQWNGPRIPDTKPPFKGVFPGLDGRIWVLLSTAAVETVNPNHDPSVRGSSATVWREGVSFDVFEADGSYLGRVDAPDNFGLPPVSPVPVFGEEAVWAVTRDELDVQRVVRYQIRPAP